MKDKKYNLSYNRFTFCGLFPLSMHPSVREHCNSITCCSNTWWKIIARRDAGEFWSKIQLEVEQVLLLTPVFWGAATQQHSFHVCNSKKLQRDEPKMPYTTHTKGSRAGFQTAICYPDKICPLYIFSNWKGRPLGIAGDVHQTKMHSTFSGQRETLILVCLLLSQPEKRLSTHQKN